MVNAKTSDADIAISAKPYPENAQNALHKSASSYTAPAGTGETTLVLNIKSVDTPATIIDTYFEVSGTSQVSYFYSNSLTKTETTPVVRSTPAAINIVNDKLEIPVTADALVITLTPRDSNTAVSISELTVSACYTPGE